jgi:NADPH:quinone reductase-like Zn-dependent oxidoreductase
VKAIVFDRYGPPAVLRVADVDPPEVGDGDVLVRVRAASLNQFDWHFMTGTPFMIRIQFGVRKPPLTRLGADLAGIVEQVGAGVRRLRPGDEVFGMVAGGVAGEMLLELGSLAELVRVPERWLAPKPANLTFAQAAAIPVAATTALQALRDYGHVQPGSRVLINDASGGVGTFAVQLAKTLGAEVTAVAPSEGVDLVRSLGADVVVDSTREKFTRTKERYDVVLDTVGDRSLVGCRRLLVLGGVYLAAFSRPEKLWLGPTAKLVRMRMLRWIPGQRMAELEQRRNEDDLPYLARLAASGAVVPVIDRTFPLEETAAAVAHLVHGRPNGKVVVTV